MSLPNMKCVLGNHEKYLGKVEFEMVVANYDINQVIRKIDSIQYSDFELIKHIFYGVK